MKTSNEDIQDMHVIYTFGLFMSDMRGAKCLLKLKKTRKVYAK